MQETWETQVQYPGQEDPLEEGMSTHSSILVWRIPWTEEPGRLQSMGSQRVRRDWSDLACMHACIQLLEWPKFKKKKNADNTTYGWDWKSDMSLVGMQNFTHFGE